MFSDVRLKHDKDKEKRTLKEVSDEITDKEELSLIDPCLYLFVFGGF